jgi:hypothetical protein
MKHVDPSDLDQPQPAHPLRTAAIIIYATLALLALTIPQSLTNWLSDMNGNPAQETALRGAEVLRNASESTGVAGVYQRARDKFLSISGVEAN